MPHRVPARDHRRCVTLDPRAPDSPTPTRSTVPKQILVVDDDPDLSLLMTLFLRKHGHEVVTAGDGRAALERVRASTPDLVVLDWNMPHLDGLGLAAAVRGELGLTSLPLLMVTALPDHAQALAAGIDKVVSKPFSSAVLIGAVEELLASAGRAPA
nr:response regulator transcription factor [Nocardioides marinus]